MYFSYSNNNINFQSEEIFNKVFSLENFTLISPKSALSKADIFTRRYEPDNSEDALVKEYLQKNPYKYDKIYHCYNFLDNDTIPLGYISIKENNNSEGYVILSFKFEFIYSEKSHKHFDCIKQFALFNSSLYCQYVSKYDFNDAKKRKFNLNLYGKEIDNSKILNKLKELFEAKKKTDINSYINKKYMDELFKKGESAVKNNLYYIYNDDVMELIRKDDFAELERIKSDYYGKIPEFNNITCEAFIDTRENELIINAEFDCQNDKLLLQRKGFINWKEGKIVSCKDIPEYPNSKYPSCAIFTLDNKWDKFCMGYNIMDDEKRPLSRARVFYELQKILADRLEFETYFNIINNSNLDLNKKCIYSLKTLEKVE